MNAPPTLFCVTNFNHIDMKTITTLLLVLGGFAAAPLLSQSEKPASAGASAGKGATPLPSTQNSKLETQNSTRAVVVGISDYEDKDIPDLRFAHRDAEAFANFLRSPAGGALDGDHLKVLTNEQATGAQLAKTLDWLIEVTQEGDRVIIYFSGHGDVETKRISQPGYLLGSDAPSRVYSAGGAMNVRDFQDIVSTLSVINKAKVVVITDACHAGKLSGSDINGAQLTGQNLARQFANEVKILSCQPDEYSIEGEQWGGGRGAFSYHLVDALYGLADGNNDLSVNLKEVGRYLEDHVTAEVAPVSQNPKVIGSPTERLAAVDAKLLADLRSGKTSQMQMLAPVDMRGMEDEVLAGVDTTVRELYRLFNKALQDKVFLEPVDACADAYYERLISEPKLARLHSTMRRNYAAALQDDAQQVMNIMLKSGLTDEVRLNAKASGLYAQYPRYLQRAAELLGEGHYMYAPLQARKQFFEGEIAAADSEKQQAYHRALHWQPDMPHALVEMIFTFESEQADSANHYFSRAAAQAPAWVAPYIFLAGFYIIKAKQPDKAEELLRHAGQLDSASVFVWYKKAMFYEKQKNYAEAEHWYLKVIAGTSTDICFPCAHNDLGAVYTITGRDTEAEAAFNKAIQLDSTFVNAYINLGKVYHKTGRFAEAEAALKKAIQLDSTVVFAYINLGVVYTNTGRYTEAEATYNEAIRFDSTCTGAFINLGLLYCDILGRYTEAEAAFQKAIQLDSTAALAYSVLGVVYANTGRYVEAEVAQQKAIQLDSTFVAAYIRLGAVYCDRLRRYVEAETVFNKAIQLDSNATHAYCNLGVVYANVGRYAEAEAAYKKAIQLDSSFVNAHINLAYMFSHQNQIDQAFEQLEKALTSGFNRFDILLKDRLFATLREQKDRWETLLQNALVPDTSDAKGWLNLGNMYIQNSQYADAEPVLEKAIALNASVAPAYYLLGKAYFKTARLEDARREFLKTIELSPQARMARLGMAWLLTAEGKTKEALEWVAQAIEKGGAPFELLQSDEDLAPLRALPEWKTLMKKNFPEKVQE